MYGDRYESTDAVPLVLQKFDSVEYGDESPRMVLHIKQKPAEPVYHSNKGNGQNNKHKTSAAQKAMRPPEEAVFDIGRERNKGNQFWKQGKGREEHRAKEIEAKQRRTNKGLKSQTIAKIQILEEPDSDEVSPGVTRTMSPSITVKSSGGQVSHAEENKVQTPETGNTDENNVTTDI